MNRFTIEIDFNVDSTVWLAEKNATGGLRLRKATVEKIQISTKGIEYTYNHNGETGTFMQDDVGKHAFASAEEANEYYSKRADSILENYGEFTAIFFMIRKKISKMEVCKNFNAGTKHCIATNLTYDLCDALDKTQPLSREATIKYLVDELSEERVNVVIESEELENDKENMINDTTTYEKVFSYINTTDDVFVISATPEDNEKMAKPLAKVFKNGIIMYIENSQNDPLVNELIEELFQNHL